MRAAGPADPKVLEYVGAAGGRFELAVRASECLLAERAERLAPRPVADRATAAMAQQGPQDPALLHVTPSLVRRLVPTAVPVFLEVFSGCAALSKVAAQAGLLVMPPIDMSQGPEHDLTRADVATRLVDLIRSKRVTWVHLGTPCTTFCRFFLMFCLKCTRTVSRPEGDGSFDREIEGNLLLNVSCRIAEAATANGTYWTMENPRTSLLWVMPRILTHSNDWA